MAEDLIKFTLYWNDGKKEVIEGTSVFDAISRNGYTSKSKTELAYAVSGDDDSLKWNAVKNQWEKRRNHNDEY